MDGFKIVKQRAVSPSAALVEMTFKSPRGVSSAPVSEDVMVWEVDRASEPA